jgi:hypothetical protein
VTAGLARGTFGAASASRTGGETDGSAQLLDDVRRAMTRRAAPCPRIAFSPDVHPMPLEHLHLSTENPAVGYAKRIPIFGEALWSVGAILPG